MDGMDVEGLRMCRGRVRCLTTDGAKTVVWARVVTCAVRAVAGVAVRMHGAAVVVDVVVHVACTESVVVRVEVVGFRTGTMMRAGTVTAMGSCIGTGVGIVTGTVGDGRGGEGILRIVHKILCLMSHVSCGMLCVQCLQQDV